MRRIGFILVLAITAMALVACADLLNTAVTGVTLNKASTTITVGATEQLTATEAPANATNQKVSWASSDQTKATVSASGLVTAVAAGPATITVTTVDGSFAATCTVTVTAAAAIPDYVGSWSGVDVIGGGTGTLTLTITTTTLHFAFAAGGSYAGSTADASLVVDETLKHMTLTVTSSTGSLVSIFPTSTVYYTTYAVTGTTLQMAMGVQAPQPFPADATGGLTLTKQ